MPPRMTPAEREAHRRESVRRENARKRLLYIDAPTCPKCGCQISVMQDCACIGDIPATARTRDIVRVLNVKTMRTGIEIK